MRYLFLLFCILFSLPGIMAQVTNEGHPKSWVLQNLKALEPLVLPEVDLQALEREDKKNDLNDTIPWRFGKELLVNYTLDNSGQWTTLENGDRIWRIRFQSKGAKTLNFVFDDFFIPKGGTIYLYNKEKTDLLGAYDSQQNNEQRVLGTWMVSGSDILLEYYEPYSQYKKGNLSISRVVHGYRSIAQSPMGIDDGLNTAGKCHYDVDCPFSIIDAYKNVNRNAVGLLIVNNSAFCSGVLINNTSNNGVPYFLTANHCANNPPANWAFRFKWISPTPVCAQDLPSSNATGYLTTSGCTIRARNSLSDFALVQINSPIPPAWGLKWAGWDRSNVTPPLVFGIHHPHGDVMKVCLDTDGSYENIGNINFWKINQWEYGTVEPGSSGSPLFNDKGRVIGQATSTFNSMCIGLGISNDARTNYGRLSTSWNTGTTAATRLRDWLDPSSANAMTADYYPPDQAGLNNAKISIFNINTIIGINEYIACGNEISPVIKIINGGTNLLSSATVTYNLNSGPQSVVNWTGSLSPGSSATISIPSMAVPVGENTFSAIIESPNGVADSSPDDNSSTQVFKASGTFAAPHVILELTTDELGSGTSWSLRDGNDNLIDSGSGYTASSTITEIINLPSDGCYTFRINATIHGICCDYGFGNYVLKTPGNTIIKQGGTFAYAEATTFKAVLNLSSNGYDLTNAVVYPNPSSGFFNLEFDNVQNIQFEVFNVLGQSIKKDNLKGNSKQIDLSGDARGIYLLKLVDLDSNKSKNFRLVKI